MKFIFYLFLTEVCIILSFFSQTKISSILVAHVTNGPVFISARLLNYNFGLQILLMFGIFKHMNHLETNIIMCLHFFGEENSRVDIVSDCLEVAGDPKFKWDFVAKLQTAAYIFLNHK